MPSFSLYEGSVPHAKAALEVMLHLLDAIDTHTAKLSIPAETLINARIALDMKPLNFQVFVACDAAMQIASRCQQIDPIHWGCNEHSLKTLEDLRKRVQVTRDVVETADRHKFVGSEEVVTFNMAPTKFVTAKAGEFVNGFALPNMYFHIVTMYNILRNQGVTIGKMDYLNFFLGRYEPRETAMAGSS